MLEQPVEKNLFFEITKKQRKVFQQVVQKPVFVELPHFIKKVDHVARQHDKSQHILLTIQQREEEFKKCAPSLCERPGNLEAVQFLKAIGITKLTKCSIA